MKQLLCPMRAASLQCPHWRPFSELQFHPSGDPMFLSSRRKSQRSASILLVVSSFQLPFLGLHLSAATNRDNRSKILRLSDLPTTAALLVLPACFCGSATVPAIQVFRIFNRPYPNNLETRIDPSALAPLAVCLGFYSGRTLRSGFLFLLTLYKKKKGRRRNRKWMSL